jgi:hypothetical protein
MIPALGVLQAIFNLDCQKPSQPYSLSSLSLDPQEPDTMIICNAKCLIILEKAERGSGLLQPRLLSQAMAWILVVGHALNLVLNKVSATSVYSLGIAAS